MDRENFGILFLFSPFYFLICLSKVLSIAVFVDMEAYVFNFLNFFVGQRQYCNQTNY